MRFGMDAGLPLSLLQCFEASFPEHNMERLLAIYSTFLLHQLSILLPELVRQLKVPRVHSLMQQIQVLVLPIEEWPVTTP